MCDYSRDDYKIDTYDPYEYDEYAGYDDKYYGDAYDTPITLDNYDELMKLAKHEKTDDKLRDILYGLIKYGKIIKKKEIGFIFDYTIEPRQKWLDIAKEFNSNKREFTSQAIFTKQGSTDNILCVYGLKDFGVNGIKNLGWLSTYNLNSGDSTATILTNPTNTTPRGGGVSTTTSTNMGSGGYSSGGMSSGGGGTSSGGGGGY